MAWTTPLTWTFGQTVTAAQLNSQIRDNLNETAVAKATTPGGYPVATAANALAERIVAASSLVVSESTASTSYTNLTTVGPQVIVTATARAIVMLSAYLANDTVNSSALMSVDISGATTQAATNSFAVRHTSATANAMMQASFVAAVPSVVAGSSTYLAKYAAGTSGNASFDNRRITVVPF